MLTSDWDVNNSTETWPCWRCASRDVLQSSRRPEEFLTLMNRTTRTHHGIYTYICIYAGYVCNLKGETLSYFPLRSFRLQRITKLCATLTLVCIYVCTYVYPSFVKYEYIQQLSFKARLTAVVARIRRNTKYWEARERAFKWQRAAQRTSVNKQRLKGSASNSFSFQKTF